MNTKKIIIIDKKLLKGLFSPFNGLLQSAPRAFTLIELLVVVLIIGILAAVALPKYQMAVEKSHAAEALVVLRRIVDAQEIYYMNNGEYTFDFSNLDADIPSDPKYYWSYGWAGGSAMAVKRRTKPGQSYFLVYRAGKVIRAGSPRVACGTDDGNSLDYAERVCKALGAVEKENDRRWILYK